MHSTDLSGKRVLVTGGSGFIGSRLVERLIRECGAQVRVMVRSYARAARVARFEVELVQGDVADRDAVAKAVAGCDVVFHAAYGNDGNEARQREVTVGGTENVLTAAKANGCQRVVHVSTINVYGATPDGDLDESAPRKYFGDAYSDTKLDAEQMALRWHREQGVPATVVQPTVVFGPFALAWTVRILGEMGTGRVMLIDGGDGLCNAVYVDDLVSGMLLAATREEAIGEAFLLSGAEPVTWRDFYGHYERMLGRPATAVVSAADALADFDARFKKRRRSIVREALSLLREERPVRQRVLGSLEGTALRGAAKLVLPRGVRQSLRRRIGLGAGKPASGTAPSSGAAPAEERPIHPMPPSAIDYQKAKTVVRIDKARRLLGYEPQFDVAAGMQRVAPWAKWAGFLS
ncbi:MAG: NAD-dependent epimerase/dehydratase family protein [Planctomycetota bacterium]